MRMSNAALDSLLETSRGKWTIVAYRHIFKDSTAFHGKIPPHAVSYEQFRRQIRLIRNTDYWTAPAHEVFVYRYEYKNAKLRVYNAGPVTSLRLEAAPPPGYAPVPLTVEYPVAARKLRVTAGPRVYIFQNKTGAVRFDLYPGETARIEILKN